MKFAVALLLLASLAANGLWWTRPGATASVNGVPAASGDGASHRGPETRPTLSSPADASPAAPSASLNWTDFPTGDLQTLADRLRERGVPAHIVRGIVGHFLGEEYRAKREALQTRMGPVRYWQNNMYSGPDDASVRAEMRSLAREQSERLNALAGTSESFYEPQSLAYLRQRFGNLPQAKIEAIQAIESDYSELMNQVRQASQGLLLSQDRELLALLEEERRQDYLSVLTPAEFEEFELRASNTASQLRRNLHAMEPTEDEFRTIYRLQRPFDEKFLSTSAPRDPSTAALRQAAERELVAAVKAALGPERGAEYEKSRDYAYVHAHSVAKNLGLPKDTGDRLWNLQRDAFQQFNRVGNDSALAPNERGPRQLEYVQSLRTAIAAEIGAENLPAYEQGGGGWLRSLEMAANRAINRPPAPPRPSPR